MNEPLPPSSAIDPLQLAPREHPLDKALTLEAWATVCGASGARAALESLIEQGLFDDAIRFLCRSLPALFLVNWFRRCLAGDMTAGRALNATEKSVVALVDTWLAQPGDAARERCMHAANVLDLDGVAALMAASVGYAGGNLSKSVDVDVPPDPQMVGATVAAGIMLLAAEVPEEITERHAAFSKLAIEMLNQQTARR